MNTDKNRLFDTQARAVFESLQSK
ncbi:hypothetical protein AB6A40_000691 [Gnathostoma spinigerum]|uniref:Uncharacterized protein n=1 Tax=Gnathostoma spinigerum TaxID=75299 RepID=A0ABD6EBC3_9BILA